VLGEILDLQDGTTTNLTLPDCRDAGCPSGEECPVDVSHGSTRHACVCPAGYERDASTQHCKPVSKSGQYLS